MSSEVLEESVARDQYSSFLVEKGTLLLTVKVENTEQADELLRWMFSINKPMKAELLELAWDKEVVSKQGAELIETPETIFSQ